MKQFVFALSFLVLSQISALNYTIIEDQCQLQRKSPSMQNITTRKILLNNGIKVYMISDPNAIKSSAALSVKVGQWQDPDAYPGTAHFLEHMLFMGNSKYPNEEEYHHFIADHGGTNNAWTSTDYTVYGASINNDAFPEFLDRLSQFFVSPLLSQSCVEREYKAVDNENTIYNNSDSRRKWRILSTTSAKEHPFSRFSTGNSQTLSKIPPETLHAWFEENYAPEYMTLCLYSNETLDAMTETCSQTFINIPHRKGPSKQYQLIFSNQQKGHVVSVKPIQNIKQLDLTWEIPFKKGTQLNLMSANFIASLLESKMEGSLYQSLLKQHLIDSIDAGAFRLSDNNILFTISIGLTEKGLDDKEAVIEKIYQTIAALKTKPLPSYLFQEMQTMQTLNYEFENRPNDPFMMVMEMAANLQYENFATFPEETRIIPSYNPHLIREILSALTPDQCLTIVCAPQDEVVQYDQVEEYYGIEYTTDSISQNELQKLSHVPLATDIRIQDSNPFMPTHLALIERSDTQQQDTPQIFIDQEGGALFYRADPGFLTPESSLIVSISTPSVNPSLTSNVCTSLYTMILSQKLTPIQSMSSAAGITVGIGSSADKEDLMISLSGYSQNASKVMLECTRIMKSPHITRHEFDLYKQLLVIQYQNAEKAQPIRKGIELLNTTLYNNEYLSSDKEKMLLSLQYEDFIDFTSHLFDRTYLKAYMAGNLYPKEATSLYSQMNQTLGGAPFTQVDLAKRKLIRFPQDQSPLQIKGRSTQLGSSTILLIQLGESDPEKLATHSILSQGIGSSFFDELRTKQQTGYQVGAQGIERNKELMHLFYVQSANYKPEDLINRYEIFLNEWTNHIDTTLSPDKFEVIRQTLIAELSQPAANLDELAMKDYSLAFEYERDFERIHRQIRALQNLDYPTFKKNAIDMVSKNNPRRFAVLVEGKQTGEAPVELTPSDTSNTLVNYTLTTQDAIRKDGTFL
ncbi:MAG: insulinase family protein [Simkaniaceae bacterium]|nr:insulinase family protein [Simkaniaceae bacterium]MCF7851654.1 insulinase family protein [Simkaniaceae bacterium]